MPDYPHVDCYHFELAELIEFGGVDNEENIRSAFQNCLAAYCADYAERLLARARAADGPQQQARRHGQGLPAHDPRSLGS